MRLDDLIVEAINEYWHDQYGESFNEYAKGADADWELSQQIISTLKQNGVVLESPGWRAS